MTHPVITTNMHFDPCSDDLTIRSNAASEDLRDIYKIVGKGYSKNKKQVERTVECLDYHNIYFNVKNRFIALNKLISIIDNFLT